MLRTGGTTPRTGRASARRAPLRVPRGARPRPMREAHCSRPTRELARASSPAELRRTLLAERSQAFPKVLATRRQLHRECLVRKVVFERGARALGEKPLREP